MDDKNKENAEKNIEEISDYFIVFEKQIIAIFIFLYDFASCKKNLQILTEKNGEKVDFNVFSNNKIKSCNECLLCKKNDSLALYEKVKNCGYFALKFISDFSAAQKNNEKKKQILHKNFLFVSNQYNKTDNSNFLSMFALIDNLLLISKNND
jgi:hypothetical protein